MALHKIPRWDVLTVRNKIRKTDPWTLSLWKGKGCKALYQEKQVMDTLLPFMPYGDFHFNMI